MRGFASIGLLAATLFGLPLLPRVFAQSATTDLEKAAGGKTFVAANNISFTVSADRPTAEEIIVKYRIRNVSNGPFYVPRMPGVNSCLTIGPEHINIWLDRNGKRYGPGLLMDCLEGVPRSIAERLSKTAILLNPGESTDGSQRFDPHQLKLMPGVYRVEAVLGGWKENEFSQAELKSLTKWDAPLLNGESSASTRITLTVN
jgi:hypothetical protein